MLLAEEYRNPFKPDVLSVTLGCLGTVESSTLAIDSNEDRFSPIFHQHWSMEILHRRF
jgi:hypothetical protein